jgi:hypothetical protein
MKKKFVYILLSIIISALISLPAIQMFFPFVEVKKLYGVTNKQELPEFVVKDWINFEYQPKLYQYLLENYGFRPCFIRCYNQFLFSAFGKYNTSVITYGKDGQLYEPWFIDTYYGNDFIGDSLVVEKVKRIKSVQLELEKRNTKLMVVINPGKASYYPEYIPDHKKSEKKRNNYEAFNQYLAEYNVPYIDFNGLFMSAKDTTKYPLFPKTGTHWSVYGGTMTLDTITRFMQNLVGRKMTDVSYTNITETTEFTDQDIDLENLMHLIVPLDRGTTATIDIVYKNDSTTYKPSVICISDSFYWILFGLPKKEEIYSDIKYWYYHNDVYPDMFKKPTYAKELDLYQQIENTDIIMVMACTSTLKDIGWGFFERAYDSLCKQ